MGSQFFPLRKSDAEAAGITNHFEYNKTCGFSVRLKELRSNKAVSQETVAKEIGITKQAVASYENGDSLPNAEKLRHLADYYNVSADYLLGRPTGETSSEFAQRISNATGLTITTIEALMYYKEHIDKEQISPALLVNSFFALGNDFWLTYLTTLMSAADAYNRCLNEEPKSSNSIDKYAKQLVLEEQANNLGYHLVEKNRAYLLFRQIANEQLTKVTDSALITLQEWLHSNSEMEDYNNG